MHFSTLGTRRAAFRIALIFSFGGRVQATKPTKPLAEVAQWVL